MTNKWQPIETAPKDGTEILVNLRNNLARYIVSYDSGNWLTQSGFRWGLSQVTHWQPLPEPPTESDNK